MSPPPRLVQIVRKHIVPGLAFCLMASTAAQAQFTGGHGHGGRGGDSNPSSTPAPATDSKAARASTPADQIEIVGVVTALGPEPDRVTISYGAVEGLNWPAGTTPFVVSKPALLQGVSVGEKVRFKLESQRIYQLAPF
jgi:Cu/Ag efflux protein CusF